MRDPVVVSDSNSYETEVMGAVLQRSNANGVSPLMREPLRPNPNSNLCKRNEAHTGNAVGFATGWAGDGSSRCS